VVTSRGVQEETKEDALVGSMEQQLPGGSVCDSCDALVVPGWYSCDPIQVVAAGVPGYTLQPMGVAAGFLRGGGEQA
jgi:hypothetical protein